MSKRYAGLINAATTLTAVQRLRARLGGDASLVKALLVGLLAVLLLLAFVVGGAEVMEGDTRSFDVYLLQRAQSLRAGHPWLAAIMRDFSALGSTAVMTLFTLISVGYLTLVSARVTALLVATSVCTGAVFVQILKAAFGRLRPEAGFADLVATGLSFPSGHTSMSAIVFLTLGALIASTRSRVPERLYVLAAAALLALLVGVSRVLLGVHWATDVLGGWAFGAAWAMAWLLLARFLRQDPPA
ncbi:phosphatase PAP2 family protein [Roseateles sp.]|uniref:phosphatase PAP2 family protein n=1 Tax=Roseateles sp. TaxID=1971397 RepID=UPI00286BC276|nr:phosphatase PAP2 family protein [Roseateles sp.]